LILSKKILLNQNRSIPMRKRIISPVQEEQKTSVQNWLNIEPLVEVEVSSEDEAHPVEFALLPGNDSGWRAAVPGEQTIRLIFSQPQSILQIMLEFVETGLTRTQQYVLCWSGEGGSLQEIVRQQWNFSPDGASSEIEQHHVALAAVKTLELTIIPDISGGNACASLKQLRIA
jgi:hypothetical protein